jgi:hypothetical protein
MLITAKAPNAAVMRGIIGNARLNGIETKWCFDPILGMSVPRCGVNLAPIYVDVPHDCSRRRIAERRLLRKYSLDRDLAARLHRASL